MDCELPSFALQTLVENAVRHAAAPKMTPTTISISARRDSTGLVVIVSDEGPGMDSDGERGAGTGLPRLRERLAWLYGGAASLELAAAPGRGVTARLRVPHPKARDG